LGDRGHPLGPIHRVPLLLSPLKKHLSDEGMVVFRKREAIGTKSYLQCYIDHKISMVKLKSQV